MDLIVIRQAHSADLPCLAAIESSAVKAYERDGLPPLEEYEPAPAEYWAPYLTAGLLWVAEDAAAGLVGFIAAEPQDGGLYVDEMDVAIAHQRQGIGRRLMQAVIDRATAERLTNLTLSTSCETPWNVPFYRSLGFVVLDEDALPPHLAATRAREGGLPSRCGMQLRL
jgi:ribosomal protein S18 acetylase RimI-like enzyme